MYIPLSARNVLINVIIEGYPLHESIEYSYDRSRDTYSDSDLYGGDTDRVKLCLMYRKRKLIVFKHENELGNAPAYQLFDRVKVLRHNTPARSYSDYEISIDKANMPIGVTCTEMV